MKERNKVLMFCRSMGAAMMLLPRWHVGNLACPHLGIGYLQEALGQGLAQCGLVSKDQNSWSNPQMTVKLFYVNDAGYVWCSSTEHRLQDCRFTRWGTYLPEENLLASAAIQCGASNSEFFTCAAGGALGRRRLRIAQCFTFQSSFDWWQEMEVRQQQGASRYSTKTYGAR